MGAKQTAQLRPRGIVTDIPAELVPPDAWTVADNVVFDDQLTARVRGYSQVFGALDFDNVSQILFAPQVNTNYWLYMGKALISVTDGSNHFDISPGWTNPANLANEYTSDTLNTLPVINNPNDFPVYWDGNTSNACQVLPDWPSGFTCESMRPYKFFLIAMNVTGAAGQDEDLVQWSDAAAPGQVPQSWTTGPASQAGNNVIGDIAGAIVDGRVLRDDFLIYKQNSTHLMQFVGGEAVFAFRTLFKTSGALNRNCIQEVRGTHFVLTDSDVVALDGQTVRSVIDESNRKSLFSSIDATNFGASFVFHNEPSNELWVCFPEAGATQCTRALVYDFNNNQWGSRDLPFIAHAATGLVPEAPPASDWDSQLTAWDADGRIWNQTDLTGAATQSVMASNSPSDVSKLFAVDSSTTADGETITALVGRESLDLGSPTTTKIVRRIWPKIKAAADTVINVRVGGQIDLKDGIQYSPVVPFTVGSSKSVDVTVTGKFISVEFTSDVDREWQLTGYEIEYQERGRF